MRAGWLTIAGVALVVGTIALAYSATRTPEYSATAVLYVTSGTDDNTQAAFQGGQAAQQRVASYAKLANSDSVLERAVQTNGLRLSVDDARSEVTAVASSDSVLLNISAVDPSPQVAENLANAVAQSMTAYVARLETPSGGGNPLAKLTVVSPARSGESPVTPKIARDVALGVLIGFFLGVLLVLVQSRFNNKIRDEADVKKVANAPVVGSVPGDALLKRRGLIDFGEGASAAAEAFRKLRTNLTFTNVDDPARAILVTSAIAVEGKTTTAMNLAAALVEAGNRVVLVDADLRRPQVNARTGLVGDIGLTNFLRGDGSLNDLVQPTQVEGLWILASGPKPPNPAELLSAKRAQQAVVELRASFDYVIIDSPPVLPVTDAVVLSQWADGVLLVARSGSSKFGDLSDAVEQVSSSHTPVIGIVLTEAPIAKSRYGYYAISTMQKKSFFRRGSEPKAIESVLEPKPASKH